MATSPRRASPSNASEPSRERSPASRGPFGEIPAEVPTKAGEPAPAGTGAPAAARVHTYAREAGAVVLLASSLYAALALASFQADPVHPEVVGADWVGPVGSAFAGVCVGAIGLGAWLVPVELFAVALPLLGAPRPSRVSRITHFAGDVLVATVVAALVHIAAPQTTAFGTMPVGGQIGELFGEVLRSLFSGIGSTIIGFTVISLVLVARASFSFIETMRRIGRSAEMARDRGAWGLRQLAQAWREAGTLELAGASVGFASGRGLRIRESEADVIIAALADDEDDAVHGGPFARAMSDGSSGDGDALPEPLARRKADLIPDDTHTPLPPALLIQDEIPTPDPPKKTRRVPAAAPMEDVPTPSPIAPVAAPASTRKRPADSAKPLADGGRAPAEVAPPRPPVLVAPRLEVAPRPQPSAEPGIRIVDTSASMVAEKVAPTKMVPAIGQGFRLPLFEMLDLPEGGVVPVEHAQLEATAAQLEKTLVDYGVSGKVVEILPGPTVTTFEVVPAAGTKVSKVASLADDLALGLSVKVRIIAPIPGKNRIGFEIPNVRRTPVNMRELVEDRRFQEMKCPLPCVLGRDIVGAPYFADLAAMPHVIVAGATGAGKSVGLNVMLVSLLYRRTPDELRFLMIDPKVVELAPFDRIPHMLLPVVTDMKQAANALKWAVDEMERRYQLFANAGTKNITTYNGYVERVLRGEAKPPKPPAKVAAVGYDGTEVMVDAAKDGSDTELPIKLPFIVIVVDEFADLMMQQGKDVETSVARLAQKARAAGMHVILATQRPSVDVITGMIKANFPTRIAFRVAQKVDSRTILDEQGAEHLLGRGDMLIKMNGSNDTRRVQGPFCTEEEVQRVTDFLRLQGEPQYDEDILKPRDEEGGAEDDDGELDSMYDQAVRIVSETRRCSTSWLQRKLGLGYNRAAKIVETMEKRGLVGPANGAKDREIFIETI